MTDPQRHAEWRRTHPPVMGADGSTDTPTRPPRDGLVRAMAPGPALEVRAQIDSATGTEGTTLFGHFSRFNEWTEIDSFFEGNFMERVAPGAYRKTFREQKPKVLLNHGMDPMLGDRVIASPTALREDGDGAYYEARLFDGLDPVLLAGLRAGEYGASFRFSVMREEWNDHPDQSPSNPRGLPERTLKELRVPEFGPVTFPAYAGATAQVRSMTDEILIGRAVADPAKLQQYLDYLRARDERTQISVSRDAINGERAATVAENSDACPAEKPHAVMADGEMKSCHATVAEAQAAADGMAGKKAPPFGKNSADANGETRDETHVTVVISRALLADLPDATLAKYVRDAAADTETSASETDATKTSSTTAPPEDRAEDTPHPDEGRRDQKAEHLFGLDPTEETSWRL